MMKERLKCLFNDAMNTFYSYTMKERLKCLFNDALNTFYSYTMKERLKCLFNDVTSTVENADLGDKMTMTSATRLLVSGITSRYWLHLKASF